MYSKLIIANTKEFVDRENQFVPTALQPNLQTKKSLLHNCNKKQEGSPCMQKLLAEETNLCQEPLILQLDLHCPDNNKQPVAET